LTTTDHHSDYCEALDLCAGISLFADVLRDPIVALALDVAKALASRDSAAASQAYAALFAACADAHEPDIGAHGAAPLQARILQGIAYSENAFTRIAERCDASDIPRPIAEQAAYDLDALHSLYMLSAGGMAEDVALLTGRRAVSMEGLYCGVPEQTRPLLHSQQWSGGLRRLTRGVAKHGAGTYGRWKAFRWKGVEGCLEAVPHPDPVRLSNLYEYEWQKAELVRNTRKLLAGLPANNALLYGNRGTGKSSTVKALLNEFWQEGLRLVEVQSSDLGAFPHILRELRGRAQRFIVYVDDLSFAEDDAAFRALKAVLEGGVEVRPRNVVLYATSNRRNLVRERFSDRARQEEDDEVHPMDSYQEKLSLADRFGLRLPYFAPDQDEFLEIAIQIARYEGLKLPRQRIAEEALRWDSPRSGRSARQFVEWLVGEMALADS